MFELLCIVSVVKISNYKSKNNHSIWSHVFRRVPKRQFLYTLYTLHTHESWRVLGMLCFRIVVPYHFAFCTSRSSSYGISSIKITTRPSQRQEPEFVYYRGCELLLPSQMHFCSLKTPYNAHSLIVGAGKRLFVLELMWWWQSVCVCVS